MDVPPGGRRRSCAGLANVVPWRIVRLRHGDAAGREIVPDARASLSALRRRRPEVMDEPAMCDSALRRRTAREAATAACPPVIHPRRMRLAFALALALLGGWLWLVHAQAWDLGGRSPILGYDSAQYALAARELAESGRFGTLYALPIELVRHAAPPWPLAVVQPGLVLVEALIEGMFPSRIGFGGWRLLELQMPHQRDWLTLITPFFCYLGIAVGLAWFALRLLGREAPALPDTVRVAAAATVAVTFLLDPEAQHFAIGGFTELPFTFGLVVALGLLATTAAPRRPFLFGLLLGVTTAFRANMMWLAPVLGLAAIAQVARGRRLRSLVSGMLGFALPLAPWWLYKWHTFGSPAWDLTRYVIWDGIEGRTLFSLLHRSEYPDLPHGLPGLRLVAAKVARNLPDLLLALTSGPRALWIGSLMVGCLLARAPRDPRPARPVPEPVAASPAAAAARRPANPAPAVSGAAVLAAAGLSLLAAAATIPWLRLLFPARVTLEAAGLLATWGLIARLPATLLPAPGARALQILVAAIALGWGGWQTARGQAEARATAAARGLPSVLTLRDLSYRLRRELRPQEPVMSNLGSTLAWYARRPVVHLALSPADVETCRQRLAFRHVVLCFRDPARAWPGWSELVEDPRLALTMPDWSVLQARRWRTRDQFTVVWLELGAAAPALGRGTPGPIEPIARSTGTQPRIGRGVEDRSGGEIASTPACGPPAAY
jgi:hypothetical protein